MNEVDMHGLPMIGLEEAFRKVQKCHMGTFKVSRDASNRGLLEVTRGVTAMITYDIDAGRVIATSGTMEDLTELEEFRKECDYGPIVYFHTYTPWTKQALADKIAELVEEQKMALAQMAS